MLLFCSCGIAALGLLQSSPAVIIGAMLISPLMGPILSMGLALARLELREFRRAAVTLLAGSVVSVLASAAIVWASPLKAVTPEILARTHPTLLDLVVALLSGVVGGYVILTRKGGVIAGVAIATALMPPLATVGYGLAVRSVPIGGGAFLLFMTNIVAIVAAVFLMARIFGFQPSTRRPHRLEAVVLTLSMAALAFPLLLSLRDIAAETRATLTARAAVEAAFADRSSRIDDIAVQMRGLDLASVDAVVVTHGFSGGAAEAIRRRLGGHVQVNLEQLLAASSALEAPTTAGALTNRALVRQGAAPAASVEDRLRAVLESSFQIAELRSDGRTLTVLAAPGAPPLSRLRSLEAAVAVFAPDRDVRIVPPPGELPPVMFSEGSAALDDDGTAVVDLLAWALGRWGTNQATCAGEASPGAAGPSPPDVELARRRAASVAVALQAHGVACTISTRVPTTAAAPEQLWRTTVEPLPARAFASGSRPAVSSPADGESPQPAEDAP